MSLQVWLPLTKDLKQQGLSNVTVTNNGATFNSAGKLGGCYLFDGSNDYMIGTYNATAEISFAAWINMPVLPGGKHIFDARTSGGTGYQPIYLTNTSIQVGCSGSGSGYPSFNYTWAVDTWYHICVTHNTTEVKCYVNGVLIGSSTTGKGIALGTCNFTLGSRCNQSNYSNVKINDARIYNHCLSEQEVKKLAQGLIVHYPLNRNGWGQDNLIPNSTTKVSSGYYVSNWTCTANTSVSNWGCTDAYRCTGSGGTNTIIGTLGIGQPSNSNFTYSYSVWVKNNHSTNKIAFSCNHYGAYSEWLNPGQAKRLILEACPGNGSSYIQLNWRTNTVGEAFDFSYWHPKIEIGDKITPWCPNSSETLATSMELNGTTEYDISGFGNNGVRTGTFSWTSDTPKYSVSTHVGSTSTKIHISDFPTSGFNNSYSFAWWGKNTAFGSPMFWGFSNGIRLNGMHTGRLWNTGDSGDNPLYKINTTTQVSAPSTNTWHHYVMTGNGTKCYVYLDGELWAEAKTYKAISGTSIYINGWDSSVNYSYDNMDIVDFRIYATALSASDVKSLYQNCATIGPDGTIYGQIRN